MFPRLASNGIAKTLKFWHCYNTNVKLGQQYRYGIIKLDNKDHTLPIDRPFRLTVPFCLVWALVAYPAYLLVHKSEPAYWIDEVAEFILFSVFLTFVLYGSVLLVWQIISSGPRGLHIGILLLSYLFLCSLFVCGLIYFGLCPPDAVGRMGSVLFTFATIFIRSKLKT